MKDFDASLESEIFEILYSFLPRESFSGNFEKLRPLFCQFDQVFKSFDIKIITVGGTNGKGETAFFLQSILESKGYKTGLWTSPHILTIKERYNFFGNNLSYLELKDEILKAKGELELSELSFYEFLFFVFCRVCQKYKEELDYIILEVGLGGKKDTVNLLTPALCALTSISRDHQEILGNRFDKILTEKLGITRNEVPLITNFSLSYLINKTSYHCKINKIPYFNIEDHFKNDYNVNSYSKRNEIQAKCLYHFLKGEGPKDFSPNLYSVNRPFLKGRFEMMTMLNIRFIFIGAHNIDGMRMLEDTLRDQFENAPIKKCFDEVWLSFSKRKEEDIKAALKIFFGLSPFYDKLWLTTFSHPKALDLEKEKYNSFGLNLPELMNWKERLLIMDKDVNKTIAITGSYYFIGEVQKFILGEI